MESILVTVGSELEFRLLCDFLEDQHIEYSYKTFGNDLFPGTALVRPYAEFTVPKEFEDVIRTFLKKEEDTGETVDTNKNHKPAAPTRMQWGKALLYSYTILATVLLLKLWIQYGRGPDEKNFKLEWDVYSQRCTYKNRETGKVSSIWSDANYDRNYEKLQSFYKKEGTIASESFDTDEDGYWDYMLTYNSAGVVVGRHIDREGDGYVDEVIIVLENKDTLILVDKNRDGNFERAK